MSNRDNRSIKLVFFGTPEFAVPALGSLHAAGFDISAVITAPDKPVGRNKTLTPSPVKKEGQRLGLDILEPRKLREDDFKSKFSGLNADLAIVVAYGKIIPADIISICHLGFINIHPSLLPKYRGPSPIQSAIFNGESQTGVSIMKIDEEVDHGPLLAVKETDIPKGCMYKELSEMLSVIGGEIIVPVISEYINGGIELKEQEHSLATFTKMFDLQDGKLDWERPADEIYNRFRALSHEPGIWTVWNGKRLKINEMSIIEPAIQLHGQCGTIGVDNNSITVLAGNGYINLKNIQLEGNRAMPSGDFLRGHRDIVGSILG